MVTAVSCPRAHELRRNVLLLPDTEADTPLLSFCPMQTREELLRFPVMPQGHLNYAATWFTLSGCIAAAALVAMRRPRAPR